jgi:hypothetical protein
MASVSGRRRSKNPSGRVTQKRWDQTLILSCAEPSGSDLFLRLKYAVDAISFFLRIWMRTRDIANA